MTPRHCTAPGCDNPLIRLLETEARWEKRRFCSRKCARIARAIALRTSRVEASKACAGCLSIMRRKPDEELYAFNARLYCSRACSRLGTAANRATRAQRKSGSQAGKEAFLAQGQVIFANAARRRKIAALPKGKFETVEEAEARGVVISRIVLTYAYALSPPGMPVGSKIGFRTGKVGR